MYTAKVLLCRLLVWLRLVAPPDYLVRVVADHPRDEDLPVSMLTIVASDGHWKWAYLRCPDDPTEVIQLSLMAQRRPNWEVTVDELGRPTVRPSIRQLDGTFAHFWLRRGHVQRCGDSGRRPQWAG